MAFACSHLTAFARSVQFGPIASSAARFVPARILHGMFQRILCPEFDYRVYSLFDRLLWAAVLEHNAASGSAGLLRRQAEPVLGLLAGKTGEQKCCAHSVPAAVFAAGKSK